MNKKIKGFTLVELIVVIGVLALLAVGAIVAFGNVQRTARRSNRRTSATNLATNLDTFNSLLLDNGVAPTALIGSPTGAVATLNLIDAAVLAIDGTGSANATGITINAGGGTPPRTANIGIWQSVGMAAAGDEWIIALISPFGEPLEVTVPNVLERQRLLGADPTNTCGVATHTGLVEFVPDNLAPAGGRWRANEDAIVCNLCSP